jgi:anthranilate phosphoribosyltransferase
MSTPAIHEIIAGRALSVEESKQLTYAIINGAIAPAQIAALLTTFAVRGIDVDVLDGFSQAVLELARPLDLGGRECIDVCGTGGMVRARLISPPPWHLSWQGQGMP